MLTLMFILMVSALGLGFDWHNQSAEETRSLLLPRSRSSQR